jgi:flagellar basal-body rod protein FlgB
MDVSPANSDLLLRLMGASILRSKVISGNVVNQNTPGYERREVDFEESLAKELRGGHSLDDLENIHPEVSVDSEAKPRADGNSVQMEDEVTASRENRLLFELYASIMRGQNRLTEIALRSER